MPGREHGAIFTSDVPFATPVVRPRDADLQRAADVLNAGERVAMLVGQGARGATDEVLAVAGVLGCGVAKALNGAPSCPTTSRSSPARSACSARRPRRT